ncbi:hypothetical protein QR680_008616 [Steinernema hermaphroditum]|uniref:Uncharacterized protein n=1 Tax=Steinernema hermaphroditum TaxID=289476 RepID=A0AA39IJI6_9BILA|nr:hypothetical protein QR680_008616 [Steinernema hermaphroditum]
MVALENRSCIRRAIACFVTALNPSFDWKAAVLKFHHKIHRHLPSPLRNPFNMLCAYVVIHIGVLFALLHPLVKEIRRGSFNSPLATVLTALLVGVAKMKKEILLFLPIAAMGHFFFKMSLFDIFSWASFRVHPQLQIKPHLTLVSKSRSDPTISLSAETIENDGAKMKQKSKSSVNLSAESTDMQCTCSLAVPVTNTMVHKLERKVKSAAEVLRIAGELVDTFSEEPYSSLMESTVELEAEERFYSASDRSADDRSESSL